MTKAEKARKKALEERMFAPRVELADELLPPKTETVTVDEIVEFLQLSAKSHQKLFHYTRFTCLDGMLKTHKLYLSRLSEMNDLNEYTKTPDANRIYLACFSYGSPENMAMWRMYGGSQDESIRLGFKANDVVASIGGKDGHKIYKVNGDNSCSDKKIPLSNVEMWSFHDVAYKYGDALCWNHNVVGIGRCRALQNVFGVREFAGYVKNFGWMSENEVRLMIKLRQPIPGLKRIAVDFIKPIKNMAVISGPVKTIASGSVKGKKVLIQRIFEECSYNPDEKITSSDYAVDFK